MASKGGNIDRQTDGSPADGSAECRPQAKVVELS